MTDAIWIASLCRGSNPVPSGSEPDTKTTTPQWRQIGVAESFANPLPCWYGAFQKHCDQNYNKQFLSYYLLPVSRIRPNMNQNSYVINWNVLRRQIKTLHLKCRIIRLQWGNTAHSGRCCPTVSLFSCMARQLENRSPRKMVTTLLNGRHVLSISFTCHPFKKCRFMKWTVENEEKL